MKKYLCAVLAACLLSGVSVYAENPSDNRAVITDCSPWAADELTKAIDLGFIPDSICGSWTSPITRAEFAELTVSYIARQYRVEAHDVYSLPSDDIPPERIDENGYIIPYFPDADNIYINTLRYFGIAEGRGDGTFDPDAPVTREEAAKILYRTYTLYADSAAVLSDTVLSYADADDIADWAKNAVLVLTDFGVLGGVSETDFAPQNGMTREQAAIAFCRLYENAPCSYPKGNINNPYSYDAVKEEIFSRYSYILRYSYETDDFGFFFGTQSAARIGGYSVEIVYKAGGTIDLYGQLGYPWYLGLTDFVWSEDNTTATCTDVQSGKKYIIDIEKALISEIG